MGNTAFSQRILLIDFLAILFGISSWIEINGLWVETPILVERLPEAWKLASYIVVITQLANIGPIIYSILKFNFTLEKIEKPAIHFTLFIGASACLLLIFFWDETVSYNGSEHSIPLFILVASLAIVDCTTAVLYLPFMSHYKSKYLMSYLIGQGFSGLVPSAVALFQGIGGNPACQNMSITLNGSTTRTLKPIYSEPKFSVEIFFGFLFIMVCFSWISFILLNKLKLAKKELVVSKPKKEKIKSSSSATNFQSQHSDLQSDNSISLQNANANVNVNVKRTTNPNVETELISSSKSKISKETFYILLIIQAYLCSFTNGILPSIQSYSNLPYGNVTYHLAVTLSVLSNPIGSFLAFYINQKHRKYLMPLLIICGSLCAAYIITTAASSPTPPLVNSTIGSWIIILVWITFTCSFSFTRACIADTLRNNTSYGHKALFFCGVFTQIGSATGAIIMFILVNYTGIFVSFNPCSS